MYITNSIDSSYTFSTYSPGKDLFAELPSSTSEKSDTVSISSEAKAAYAAYMANLTRLQDEALDFGAGQDGEEEDSATDAFSRYLDAAKGNSSDGGNSVQEKIEALKKKLQTLQNNLSKVAQDTSLPPETRQSREQAINGQIQQVLAQIAELEAEAAAAEA